MMNRKNIRIILVLVLALIPLVFSSCVETPVENNNKLIEFPDSGALILCEGLQGYDNSSLTRVSIPDWEVENNSYSMRNNKDYLGDTANDILVTGDTAFIAVTTGNIIEVIQITTGKKIGSIKLPSNYYPRKFTLAKNNKAYVTNLRDHSITSFDTKTFEIIDDRVECGPFPEGIANYNGIIYTANSALGYFFKDHPLAATISVIDEENHTIIDYLYCGQNMQEVEISGKNNFLFGLYYNTYEKDSIGGLKIFDLQSYDIIHSFEMDIAYMELSKDESRLYFIKQSPKGQVEKNRRGLSYLDLNTFEIVDLIENPESREFWYGLAEHEEQLWVCNAKNFLINGEFIIFDKSGNELFRNETGINPNNIRFY